MLPPDLYKCGGSPTQGAVSARRATFQLEQVPRKSHTRQGASGGCADGDGIGRIRHRHQNHPRPLPSHQPTAAKVQTGTECLTFSAKTISRRATGCATDEPTDQPSPNRRNLLTVFHPWGQTPTYRRPIVRHDYFVIDISLRFNYAIAYLFHVHPHSHHTSYPKNHRDCFLNFGNTETACSLYT